MENTKYAFDTWTGEDIKTQRKKMGYTQTELAQRLKLGKRGQITISEYEKNKRKPKRRFIIELLKLKNDNNI